MYLAFKDVIHGDGESNSAAQRLVTDGEYYGSMAVVAVVNPERRVMASHPISSLLLTYVLSITFLR